jgi:glucan phosphoethanolaminetransferase (alkaline phosphatase superfamily)
MADPIIGESLLSNMLIDHKIIFSPVMQDNQKNIPFITHFHNKFSQQSLKKHVQACSGTEANSYATRITKLKPTLLKKKQKKNKSFTIKTSQ